ncbi:MAG: hypothetical protein QOI99_2108 [Actinomycetota bacterium]|jgi:hypothetical protein|nr:hypothetical protein [Actinomycetota bacterium]
MRKKRLLASLAVAAGLGLGGLAGVIVGVPTVAGAQTTTVPPTTDPATPATPAAPGTPATPDRPPHDSANCPNMGGSSDGTGSSNGSSSGTSASAAVYHHGPGSRGGATTSL